MATDDKIQTIALSKIAAELAEKHEMSKKAAGEFLSAFVELTVKNLKKGHKVRVTGLGIFQVKKRPARMGRNPLPFSIRTWPCPSAGPFLFG